MFNSRKVKLTKQIVSIFPASIVFAQQTF